MKKGLFLIAVFAALLFMPVGIYEGLSDLLHLKFKPGIYVSSRLSADLLESRGQMIEDSSEVIEVSLMPFQFGPIIVTATFGGGGKNGENLLQTVLPISKSEVQKIISAFSSHRKEEVKSVFVARITLAEDWQVVLEKKYQEVQDCLGVKGKDLNEVQFQIMPPKFRHFPGLWPFRWTAGVFIPPNKIDFGYEMFVKKDKDGERFYHDVVKHEMLHFLHWRKSKNIPLLIFSWRQIRHLPQDGFGECDKQ